MSFESALTVIGQHLTAAGTALTPKVLDVDRGAPVDVPHRMWRYWYAGNGSPAHYDGRQTLTDRMVGERVQTALYVPISDKSVLRSLDAELYAAGAQVFTRLLGDCQLGGNCDDLDVGDAEVDYPVINGQQTAELLIQIILDFGTAYTIAA